MAGQRAGLVVLSAAVSAVLLLLTRDQGYNSLAYTLAFGPSVVSLPFVLVRMGRWVCLASASAAGLVDLLLSGYGALLFLPAAGLVLWAGRLRAEADH